MSEILTQVIAGKRTLEEVGYLVRSHHAAGNDTACLEADLVGQRIAELLASGAFFLAPEMLSRIHAYLFQDLDPTLYHPGIFKTDRMVNQEKILNGGSVLYADPFTYDMSLQGAFASEAAKNYGAFSDEELRSFCHTIAFLWQIHPFHKGNTQTVAVFSELYLNYLGFQVENAPFENHACYFRDALVRAMYRNAAANIFPDDSFLIKFYENLLGLKRTVLSCEEMVCTSLFDNPSLLRNIDPQEALVKKS